MVTPVTDEKMDDRNNTIQLSHSRHTHTQIRLLNGGEQHNGNVGIYRQKKLEGEAVGPLHSQWLLTTVKNNNKKTPRPPPPTHTSTSTSKTLVL